MFFMSQLLTNIYKFNVINTGRSNAIKHFLLDITALPPLPTQTHKHKQYFTHIHISTLQDGLTRTALY